MPVRKYGSRRKKHRIQSNKKIRFINNGRTALVPFDEVVIPGENRKSFHVLAKNKEGREWGASYDYDEKGNLKDIEIARGTTREESPLKRAGVVIPIDKNDEFAVHNHPTTGDNIADRWNRPSGQDIDYLIQLKLFSKNTKYEGNKLRAFFIHGPDGRYYRYKIVNNKKAKEKAINTDLYTEFNDEDKKRFSSKADKVIEEKYTEIFNAEYENAIEEVTRALMREYNNEQEKLLLVIRKLKQQIKKAQKKNDDKKKKELEKKLKAQYEKYKKNQHEYLVKKDKIIKEKQEIIKRRTYMRSYYKWKEWLLEEWGVEVKRMPRNFKEPIQ